MLSSVLLGLLYPTINKEFDNPLAFFNGFTIGFLGGLAIAVNEDHRHYKSIKRELFAVRLFKRVIIYTFYFALIVALVVATTYGISSGQGLLKYISGPQFQQFIFHGDYLIIVVYALFFCGLVSFTLMMSRKIESRIMFNIISGKYRKPVEEERIFMAIDLNNSTKIAEELEVERYCEFINQFYMDLTPAILSTNGQIYRYVGDQVLISWPVQKPGFNIRCLRTYFIAKNELTKQQEVYLSKWGYKPSFKAVIHTGKVVAGEIGDIKSQFVFHGAVLHQLARMEKHCNQIRVSLLLSNKYTSIIDLPSFYKLQECQQLTFNDNTEPMVLYTVKQLLEEPLAAS